MADSSRELLHIKFLQYPTFTSPPPSFPHSPSLTLPSPLSHLFACPYLSLPYVSPYVILPPSPSSMSLPLPLPPGAVSLCHYPSGGSPPPMSLPRYLHSPSLSLPYVFPCVTPSPMSLPVSLSLLYVCPYVSSMSPYVILPTSPSPMSLPMSLLPSPSPMSFPILLLPSLSPMSSYVTLSPSPLFPTLPSLCLSLSCL